jgi:hypothetical protein
MLFSFLQLAQEELGNLAERKKPISTCVEMGLSSCGE